MSLPAVTPYGVPPRYAAPGGVGLRRGIRPAAAAAEKFLSRGIDAPNRARRYTDAVLLDWGLAAAADDMRLVVTEIVTNAVRHGRRGDVRIRLDLQGDMLTVTAQDETPYVLLPPAAAPAAGEESGRGLFLVQMLASRWGHGPVEGSGTAVWAEFDLAAVQ